LNTKSIEMYSAVEVELHAFLTLMNRDLDPLTLEGEEPPPGKFKVKLRTKRANCVAVQNITVTQQTERSGIFRGFRNSG
jgi:hypothetical protein